MKLRNLLFLTSVILLFVTNSCKTDKGDNQMQDSLKLTINKFPDRIKNSVIYEVNVRQYTAEGTFKAFEKHLPDLQKLGVDILWFMPVQPTGKLNRKGSLGSYYSIKNYTKINPEFGTKADFKHLVEDAHKRGMLVLIDWVANHTAWDNPWIKEHPDWYTHNKAGQIISPVPDWTDVADLNYHNQQMRNAMVDAMKYWIKNFDIDGFRCDVAMMVPTDFWDSARVELDKVKPVFMLAEAGIDNPDLMQKAFDMDYSWDLYHAMNDIAAGKENASALPPIFKKEELVLPARTIRMRFTSNHDENSWDGTVFERMPNSYQTFAALTFLVPGMPLIYSGQEACLNHRLRFFDKDTIQWKHCVMTDLYKKLISLKKQHIALWNEGFGAGIDFVQTSDNTDVFAFVRQKNNDKILCIFNLSNQNVDFYINDALASDKYTGYFSGKTVEIKYGQELKMKPWQYLVLIKKKIKL